MDVPRFQGLVQLAELKCSESARWPDLLASKPSTLPTRAPEEMSFSSVIFFKKLIEAIPIIFFVIVSKVLRRQTVHRFDRDCLCSRRCLHQKQLDSNLLQRSGIIILSTMVLFLEWESFLQSYWRQTRTTLQGCPFMSPSINLLFKSWRKKSTEALPVETWYQSKEIIPNSPDRCRSGGSTLYLKFKNF